MTDPKIKSQVVPEGMGTIKTKGVNTTLCTKTIIAIAIRELFKDFIIMFQPACKRAANNMRKKIDKSIIN